MNIYNQNYNWRVACNNLQVGTCAIKGSALPQALASVSIWTSLPSNDDDDGNYLHF